MQLVLDSSGSYLVLGLGKDGAVVRECALPGASPEARDLLVAVRALLADAEVEPAAITQIGVGVGPGSFIGTRAAICFANGFAATAKTQLHHLPSLAAYALGVDGAAAVDQNSRQSCIVLRDARRGEAYVHLSRSGPQDVNLIPYAELPAKMAGTQVDFAIVEESLPGDRRAPEWIAAIEAISSRSAPFDVRWCKHLTVAGLLALLPHSPPVDYAEPLYLRGFL
jgi:tRNA threonylcarbamoyl adenosine modification protein YeaZ